MATAVRVLLGVVAIFVIGTLALFLLPAIGDVSGKSLSYSLTREAEGSVLVGIDPCDRKREHLWMCYVPDSSGSANVEYRVTMQGTRCWRAVKTSSGEEPPPLARRPEGCVKLRDQVRPVDRVLSFVDAE